MTKLVLAEIILKEEFMGATISGMQRLGKSSYALQVMYDIYQDWDKVFANMFFKIDELVSYLSSLVDKGEKVPCILWDDAGVSGSSQVYWTDKELYRYLGALTDVIGTTTRGLLMTTPNPYGLVKTIRSYEWLIVRIIRANSEDARLAKGYRNLMLPSGDRQLKKVFIDQYSTMLPDNVYSKYIKIRRGYNRTVLDAFRTRWDEARLLNKAKLTKAANYLEGQEAELKLNQN